VKRTDVVVESDEGAGEFWGGGRLISILRWGLGGWFVVRGAKGGAQVPLSPFMTTQMREPTHLSMSSVGGCQLINPERYERLK
jgi:hypothetical protein